MAEAAALLMERGYLHEAEIVTRCTMEACAKAEWAWQDYSARLQQ